MYFFKQHFFHLSFFLLVAEDGLEPPSFWLWAKRDTTSPLCYVRWDVTPNWINLINTKGNCKAFNQRTYILPLSFFFVNIYFWRLVQLSEVLLIIIFFSNSFPTLFLALHFLCSFTPCSISLWHFVSHLFCVCLFVLTFHFFCVVGGRVI